MFDNLRKKSAEQAEFLNEEAVAAAAAPEPKPAPRRLGSGQFLGLTPGQRFVLALVLFLNVSMLGCLALLVFQKITLPFF
jgi:hypothetical protein